MSGATQCVKPGDGAAVWFPGSTGPTSLLLMAGGRGAGEVVSKGSLEEAAIAMLPDVRESRDCHFLQRECGCL